VTPSAETELVLDSWFGNITTASLRHTQLFSRKSMHASRQNPQECPCLSGDTSYQDFENRRVGVDRNLGEVTVSQCKRCGQFWLHYLMEYEYLTAAGRWFRGPITPKIAASVTAASATKVLEELDWYFRGGSAFGGIFRTSPGRLKQWLIPSAGP